MNKYNKFVGLFNEFYDINDIKIDEKLSEYVNFKVGGPADILLIPNSKEQVIKSIKICKENNIPFYLIGNGSNILVRDGGFRGVVLSLKNVKNIYVDGEKIEAECGVMLKEVSDKAIENSLTGFEFACGIPGTIGGAVFMNAGAYDGEIAHVIESAEIIDEECNIVRLSNKDLDFGYRSSIVMKKGYTVLSAVFKLEKGQVKTIKELIEDLTNKRESKQPLEYPSAGSTFKRPTGYFAGKLIQDAGLKGYSIGGAAVSEKHSGFVINKGNATAKDITDLIKHIQDEVKKQFGVDLHPEVRIKNIKGIHNISFYKCVFLFFNLKYKMCLLLYDLGI